LFVPFFATLFSIVTSSLRHLGTVLLPRMSSSSSSEDAVETADEQDFSAGAVDRKDSSFSAKAKDGRSMLLKTKRRSLTDTYNPWHTPWSHLCLVRDPDEVATQIKDVWNNLAVVSTLVAGMSLGMITQPTFNDLGVGDEHWNRNAFVVQMFGVSGALSCIFCICSVMISIILGSQMTLLDGEDVTLFISHFEFYVALPEVFFMTGLICLVFALVSAQAVMFGRPVWIITATFAIVAFSFWMMMFFHVKYGVDQQMKRKKLTVAAERTISLQANTEMLNRFKA
jgi:hypothetical protein